MKVLKKNFDSILLITSDKLEISKSRQNINDLKRNIESKIYLKNE